MSQTNTKKNLRHHKKKPLWPFVVLIGGGVLLLVGLIFAFNKPGASKAAIDVTGSPALRVDKEQVDLGDIKLGRTVEVSFEISNVGDKPLRFTKTPYIEVKEGC